MDNFPDYANDDNYRPDDQGVLRRWKGSSGIKDLMKLELMKRMKMIDQGLAIEWETQNSFYYYMRTIFLEKGIDPQHEGKLFRKHALAYITEICHELGTTREDLNIIAKERATLYHKGEQYKISLRQLEKLAEKGTDIIIIEKSGICQLLAPYAAKAGIALLDSEGFIVEYARKLSQLSQTLGCNIAILTDFDDSGLLMARKVIDEIPQVYRIGIALQTIEQLAGIAALGPKLALSAIEESYSTGTAFKYLNVIGPRADEDREAFDKNLNYVSNKRIEIDSIKRAIGTENLWKFIKMKLQEAFPQRDYNRSMTVHDIVYPSVYWDFKELLDKKIQEALEVEVNGIKVLLAIYDGIINDIEKKENEIDNDLREIIEQDKSFKPIVKGMETLVTKLKKL